MSVLRKNTTKTSENDRKSSQGTPGDLPISSWEADFEPIVAQERPHGAEPPENPYNQLIKDFNVEELLELRHAIEMKLPARSIADLSMDEELVRQYLVVQEMQRATLNSQAPDNQKAQVANAVAAVLEKIIKLQSSLHTAERFKQLEALMIRAVKKMPVDVADEWLAEYEKLAQEET